MEYNHCIKAVDKLRPEGFFQSFQQLFAHFFISNFFIRTLIPLKPKAKTAFAFNHFCPDVRSHDNDAVAEVHFAPFSV